MKVHPALAALLSVAPVAAAGFAGSLVTMPAIPTWYAGLAKPFFTPPNWLFGPAWTLLYVLMASAFWRILTLDRPAKRNALDQATVGALGRFFDAPPDGIRAAVLTTSGPHFSTDIFSPSRDSYS